MMAPGLRQRDGAGLLVRAEQPKSEYRARVSLRIVRDVSRDHERGQNWNTAMTTEPQWHWESTSIKGGRIVGSCRTSKELGEMVTKLAEHPETDQIRVGKLS